jgi:glycerol-3-phosphate dehydrogenase
MTRLARDPAVLDATYDVIVIGGGITGVCVAREFAGRGATTLLVEKDDFGHGTSAATSKYLHGGIRYLEQYQFDVVRESLRERRVMALAAPHLVHQQRFVMPAWSWSTPPTALIGAGVGLYTALGFDRNRDVPEPLRIPLPRWIPRARLLRDIPWLDPRDLQGAFAYHDTFNVHPERLLMALLKSAISLGATACNYARAAGFLTEPGDGAGNVRVTGVHIDDTTTGTRHTARATAVVNAAGPWLDEVLDPLQRPLGVRVARAKGIHLLTTPVGGRPVADTVFARVRSGAHVIVSPWQGMSMIGPTDTPSDATVDDTMVTPDDVSLVLGTINAALAPGIPHLDEDDIEGVTVGVRPLIATEGKNTYATSRRHEVFDHGDRGVRGLWSIGGGKWTTARGMASDVADALFEADALGVPLRPFDSRRVAAFGSFGWAEDPEPYLAAALHSDPHLAVDPQSREHLARLYGTEHQRVLDVVRAQPTLGARLSARAGRFDIGAQVVFAITDEAAVTLADVLDRRLVLGTLGNVTRSEVEAVAAVAAPCWGWSDDQRDAAVEAELARRALIEAVWRGAPVS